MKPDIKHLLDSQLKGMPYYQQAVNLLTALPILLVVSLIFLVVSMFSTVKEVQLTTYMEKAAKWNDDNLAQRLSEIKIAARIMPSQNTQDNMLYLNWESMTTDIEAADAAAAQDYIYNKSLHIYNDTRDYFPTLNLNPEFVPVGNSKKLCIHIAWNTLAQSRVSSLYKPVSKLPTCSEAMNPKFRWQHSDPKTGVDINIWRQHIEDISCSTTLTCQMACAGVYKPGPDGQEGNGKCYTYDVLKAVCLEVGLNLDQETAEETWEYRGGCFEHDSPTLFERAVPGAIYEFDFVPIEVRADDDPFTVASKSGTISQEGGTDLSYFGWLSWLAFSFVLIGGVVLASSIATLKLMKQRT